MIHNSSGGYTPHVETGLSTGRGVIKTPEEKNKKQSKPKDSAVGRAEDMKSQTVVMSVGLLGLCCLLLIPTGGESAGGIVSLRQSEGERQAGDLLRDESLDDPESEQGLVVDPHPLGSSSKAKRDTEKAAQAGEWRHMSCYNVYRA